MMEEQTQAHANEINIESVITLRKTGLTWIKIAQLFGISRNSMYKFRRQHRIDEPNGPLTDTELIRAVEILNDINPTCGSVLVRGHLLSMGFRVAEKRVRAALRQVNPQAVEMRRGRRLYRRVYRVHGANYLWNIDGNHKLVMFHWVIHGCVDGFSRRIMFLKCSPNNKATTVLEIFREAAEQFGMPHRVRGDHGVENVDVNQLMSNYYGEDGRFIHGPSVHNTRIERLWRDVNEKITRPFKEIFVFLEEEEMLNETNVLDIFCLHFVYFHRIQISLCEFTEYWNNHALRTENMRSPNQLWLLSLLSENSDETYNLENLHFDFSMDSLIRNITDSSFLSNVSENELEVWFHEAVQILPNPLTDDGAHGTSHYCNLRNHLMNL